MKIRIMLKHYLEKKEIKKLNKLEGKISDEEMQEMNYKVTVKNEDPYNVAKHYLEKEGLVK